MLQAVPIMLNFLTQTSPEKFPCRFFISVYVASLFVPPDQVGKERLLLD